MDWAAFSVLALAVAWAPFPFGSAQPAWAFVVECVVFLAVALKGIALVLTARETGKHHSPPALREIAGNDPADSPQGAASEDDSRLRIFLRRACFTLALAGMVWALLQCVDLPQSALSTASPFALRTRLESGVYPAGFTAPTSLNPYVSRWLWMRWAALGMIFGLIAFNRSPGQRAAIPAILIAVGVILALLGIAQAITAGGRIYWRYKLAGAYATYNFGPFVNRNHYGGYIAVLLCFGLAWALNATDRAARAGLGLRSLLECAAAWTAFCAMFGAQVMCASRSGFAAAAAGLALTGGVGLTRIRSPRLRWMLPLGVAVVALLTAALVGRELVSRLSTALPALEYRRRIWADALRVSGLFAVSGCGNGAFERVFASLRSADLGPASYLHPENDYLQILCEMGVPGAVMFFAFAGIAFVSATARYMRTRREDAAWPLPAALGGMLALSVQGMANANLRMTSHAALAALLAGIAVAPPVSARAFRPASGILLGLALVLCAGLLLGGATIGYLPEESLRQALALKSDKLPTERREHILETGLSFSPGHPQLNFELGECARERLSRIEMDADPNLVKLASESYAGAIRACPVWSEAYLKLGMTRRLMSEEAALKAEGLFLMARRMNPSEPMCLYELGEYYKLVGKRKEAIAAYAGSLEQSNVYLQSVIHQGILLCETLADWRALIPEQHRRGGELALALWREKQKSLARKEIQSVIERAEQAALPPPFSAAEAVVAVLEPDESYKLLEKWHARWPDAPSISLYLAEALARNGRHEDARDAFLSALPHLQGMERLHTLVRLGQSYEASGNTAEAEKTFNELVGTFPRHARSWSERGAFLERAGRIRDALDNYSRARLNFPKDAEFCSRLALLHEKNGDIGEALKFARIAATLAPDNGIHTELLEKLESGIKSRPDEK